MSIPVNDVTHLQQYLSGVMGNAWHHAQNVQEIALALAGAIIWRKDEDHALEVKERDGEMKNVLWVFIHGIRYAFSYNHHVGTIEMRNEGLQGRVLHSFSNTTPLSEIRQIFGSL